jgi:phosphoglycerate dehydrogenase-like enzyme
MAPLSVHIIKPPDESSMEVLWGGLATEMRLTFGNEVPANAEYDVLVGGFPERNHLTASPRLRILVVPWTGVPNETLEMLLEFPKIDVHNLHYPAFPVAEGTVALLLAAAKLILPADRSFRRGDWTLGGSEKRSILLCGKTVLILGYGAIGKRVARICRAMDMNVLALRRSSTEKQHIDGIDVHPPPALPDLLRRSDVLIVCLPLTPETEGMIGKRELARLPRGAILVNIGRGPIVQEEALYNALKNRTLAAAGLDVWYNYPKDDASRLRTFPSTYPFHELDNVVMSPHRTGLVTETEQLRMEALAGLLNVAARGQEVPNRVDLQAGY